MHKKIEFKEPTAFVFEAKYKIICAVFVLLGFAGFGLGMATDAHRAWQAYLMGLFFTVSVSLMAVFFLALQHLTGARWSVNIRRVFESFYYFLPIGFVLTLVYIFGGGAEHLYSWLNPETVAHDALLQHKAPYLNKSFFIIRMIVVFVGWILFSNKIVGNSLKQDQTGDDSLMVRVVPFCVAFIVFFALSYSIFSVDLLMSLEPHWFSTIFGVYMFGGSMQAFFAAAILLTVFLCKRMNGMVTLDHMHDLGKFLLGFTVFWAYIAYSQYMLIWYANMPEETIFFFHRSIGEWANVSLALIVLKFALPFLLLLPRWAKRTVKYIVPVCVLILFTQFLDLYWLVYPTFDDHHAKFGLAELGIVIGFIGLLKFSVFSFLAKHSLLPVKDPRVIESAGHEVVY
jgi:hypothetical protein